MLRPSVPTHRRVRGAEGGRSDWFVLSGGLAAFGTYFCMYAFRKPFTAVTYAEAAAVGWLDFKMALVIAQLLGYAVSKFIGIRVISELRPGRRRSLLIGLIVLSELALIGFALVEDHWSAVLLLFLNGLPLGLIWGIVFSYLEGRRATELLGAVLAVSFIVSSGVVKTVGAAVAQLPAVSVYAMPALTGALFFPALLGFAWWLGGLPPPSARDVLERTLRVPMDGRQRRALLRRVGPGLLGILLYYLLITVLRDVRDSFAAELWMGLGYGDAPAVFALAELPIGLITLLTMVAGYLIADNRRALRYYHLLIVVSTLIILLATASYSAGLLAGPYWMVAVGLGLYLGYVPLNAIYFDRLVGAFRQAATAGFLIYLADAGGYAGSVAVILIKNFAGLELSWLRFFTTLSYGVGTLGLLLAVYGWTTLERRLASIHEPPIQLV